jgi:D-alanine-D-alanine ligase
VTRPVVVLAGGLSHERDVSLRSGRRAAEALRAAGVEVAERDVDGTLRAAFTAEPPACVVPMLHGESGEDGAIREVLDLLGVPYVGAGPAACRTAFDKPVAKTLVAGVGISTPESVVLPHETFRELGAQDVMAAVVARLGLPLVVKPARGGSALGCTLVSDEADLPDAMVDAFAYGPVALIERFVAGTEVAVPVLDDGTGPRALPVVAIRADGGIYDYTARYTAGSTEFTVPAPLPADVLAECARVAVAAHEVLGLRELSRSDLIVAADGSVAFLEVNVAPGFTETSLVPLSVEAAGLDLGDVLASLVRAASARDVRAGSRAAG